MKKLFMIMALCAVICSCTKDNDYYTTFIANSEMQYNDAKTHLEPNDAQMKFEVIWDPNDQIIVYGGDNTSGIFTNENIYDDDNNQVAHFSGSTVSNGTYYSFYPVSISNSSSSYTLPSVQQYRLKSDGYVIDYPMYAQENSDNNHLYFRNLCGLAILYIHVVPNSTIRNVILREPNDPYNINNGLCGDFDVTCTGSTHTNSPTVQVTDPKFEIKLDCTNNPQTLTNGTLQFYMYVPPSIHRWLIVGIEYQRPGSSEWETTYQTIYATNYGKSYFTFERSKWNFIDVDFSGVDDNEIYKAEDVEFGGDDTLINTGVKITDSYDSYTFLVDVTPDNVNNPATYQRAIFSEMDYGSPWDGVLIRVDGYANTVYNNSTYGNMACYQFVVGTHRIKGPQAVAGVRQKFICTVNTSTNTITIYWLNGNMLRSNSATISSSEWITNYNPTSQVGGDQHKANRYFDGSIHQFSIYDKILSTVEMKTWLQS